MLSALRFPLTREQELRVALTARDMAEGGSWVLPHYRGQPRFQKPPLMYWLTATAYRIAGCTDSALAARSASTCFSLALLVLIYAGGRFLVGRRAALYAAVFAGTSFLFLRFGFRSEADMPQSFFVSLSAFAAFHALRRAARPAGAWTVSGAAAGLGFLAKGLGGAVLPLLAAAGAAALPGFRGRAWRTAILAPIVFAVLALPWYLAVLGSSPLHDAAGAAVGKEMQALFVQPTHPGPPVYYLYMMPVALAPWGLLLWLAVPTLVRHARRRPGVAFLAVWMVTTLLALSLLKNKQIHYCTLLLPPASLAAGLLVARSARGARRWTAVAARHYAAAVAVLLPLAGGAMTVAPWIPAARMSPSLVPYGLAVAMAGLAGLALRRRGPGRVTATVAAGVLVLGLAGSGPLGPLATGDFVMHAAADEIRGRLAPGATLFVVGGDDATFEFHGRPAVHADSFEAAWTTARPGDVVVVSSSKRQAAPAAAPHPDAEYDTGRHRIGVFLKP